MTTNNLSSAGDDWRKTPTGRLRRLFATVGARKTMLRLGMGIAVLAILILGLFGLNKLVFEMRLATGQLCESGERNPTGTSTVRISSACTGTGLLLEKGRRYRVTVKELWEEPPAGVPKPVRSGAGDDALLWRDGPDIEAGPDGFLEDPGPLHLMLGLMRRSVTHDWFRLLAQVGNKGGNLKPLKDGYNTIEPSASGELFVYVNDAVFGLLPDWDRAYRWDRGYNLGMVQVTVEEK